LQRISAFVTGIASGAGSKAAFCHCERWVRRYAVPMRYSLDEIETFLTVMELGTVSATAARLNLSKSVISKRVSDFERTVGAALFRRNAGRITPTEAANRLSERLRPALAELVAATESGAWGMDGAAPLRGSLAIAAPMSFGTMHLSPILARFAAAHPELELRIDYDDRARDLARDGFDIGVRIGEARDGALKARKLCEDRQVVVAAPSYLARHGTPEALADLRHHQVITYAHLADVALWQFRQGDRTVSPQVRGRLALNNGEAMCDLAIAGLGLAMLPGFIVSGALKSGTLVRILPEVGTRAMPVMAVWPPVSPMPAKLRAIIDHLAAELADGGPWR
jgi:DNA-binding transcriptional LysR family regulator